MSGIGTIVERAPWVLDVVRWLGVAFLTWYGVARCCARPEARDAATPPTAARPSAGAAVAVRALALTWLNPHVYLDTVLLLGSIANHEGPTGRWWFAAGACVASALWFCGPRVRRPVGRPLLARPRAWQVLDVLIGLTMLAIAGEPAQCPGCCGMLDAMTDQELLAGYVDVWWQAVNDFTDLLEELDDERVGDARPTSPAGT